MNSTSKVDIEKLNLQGATQARDSIHDETVTEYAEKAKAGIDFPPIVVFFDGSIYWVGDGFHRANAYLMAGLKKIPADVRQGTRRDAVLYSVGANDEHGLKRSNADKRCAVLTLLGDAEWSTKSDRWIAERCRVSAPFVAGLRPTTVNVYSSNPAETTKTGKDGKARRPRKPQKPNTANAQPPPNEPNPDQQSDDDEPVDHSWREPPGEDGWLVEAALSEIDRVLGAHIPRCPKQDAPDLLARIAKWTGRLEAIANG